MSPDGPDEGYGAEPAPDFKEVAKRSAQAGIADELNRAYEPERDGEAAGRDPGNLPPGVDAPEEGPADGE